jgi:elongation factor 1 alpha-like protein
VPSIPYSDVTPKTQQSGESAKPLVGLAPDLALLLGKSRLETKSALPSVSTLSQKPIGPHSKIETSFGSGIRALPGLPAMSTDILGILGGKKPITPASNTSKLGIAIGGIGTILQRQQHQKVTDSRCLKSSTLDLSPTMKPNKNSSKRIAAVHSAPKTSEMVRNSRNGLAASPSDFTLTLIKGSKSMPSPLHILDRISSSYPLFLYSCCVTPFSFNTPSPDDIVLLAQAKSKAFQNEGEKHPRAASKAKNPTPTKKPGIKSTSKQDEGDSVPNLAKNVASLTLSEESTPDPVVVSKKKINIAAEYQKRPQQLNLVIVGHVDAGKSTLTGHMMYQVGAVSDKVMRGYHRDSAKQGKGSFSFAWVLDQNESERSHGVTIDVGMTHLKCPSGRIYTLLDAPGHRDYVPNMISGASQADVAVLVVDAAPGEFEAGLDGGGQTREHLMLIKSLGISRVVVALNKMDCAGVNWNQNRYQEVVDHLSKFLLSLGYHLVRDIHFVPTSGLSGENLTERLPKDHEAATWVGELPCLLEVLDQIPLPTRPVEKPFRLLVTDHCKGGAASGSLTVWGRVEAGGVQIGDTVLLMPLGEEASIRSIQVQNESVKWCAAGDHVELSLGGPDAQQISAGIVLCPKSHPIPVTNRIEAKILVFEPKVPITLGYPVCF